MKTIDIKANYDGHSSDTLSNFLAFLNIFIFFYLQL